MANRTRRRFLEETLLATAAASVAPAARVFADDAGQSASPNEKLSVGIVGAGGRSGAHLAAFAARKDTEVTCICDADENRAQQRAEWVAKKQGGRKPKVVRDMREAFDDKSIDIISSPTPNHWHSLVAIWAMQAGKDVYIEKPVSHNVSEGRRAVETARKYKKICQTGSQCRSGGGMNEAVAYIKAGKIGECKLARGLCYKLRKPIGVPGVYDVPKGVDYNLWLGPAQMAPVTRPRFHYDWHWQSPYGNGDLGNQGVHQMDIARWGLGVDQLSDRVFSYGGRVGEGWDEDAGDTGNTQVVVHECGDKTLVFEVRNMKCPKFMDAAVGVIFYGTDGYVGINSYNGGAAFDKDGKMVKKFNAGGDHFDNFVKAVRSRKHEDLTADILEGHLSAALCHTGNISYYAGQQLSIPEIEKKLGSHGETNEDMVATFGRVKTYLSDNNVDLKKVTLSYGPQMPFDPKTETFIGNAEADKQLTREYRKPFVVPKAGEV